MVSFVSCDCPDTDFVFRITDVDENGRSVKLADGVLGAKYRNGFETPEYMEPGRAIRDPIRTTKISNTFSGTQTAFYANLQWGEFYLPQQQHKRRI